MPSSLDQALAYVRSDSARFLEDLVAWCAIPSISSMPAHAGDMLRAAEWGADRLGLAGLEDVAVLSTAGHPVVYGEWLGAGSDQPTVLVYGHYDVQPTLDLEAWQSPPFEPRERERLACDYSLNNDSGMISPSQPAIVYGLRGMAKTELAVIGPRSDVHSGTFGGVLHNPAQALCELLAGMHDESGRITLPGFYDRVRALEADERAELALLPLDERHFLQASGAPALWGEPEFTPYERTSARPTLEVLAIHAGLGSEGALNIVPARATAVLSMRLVPSQDPDECYQSLLKHLQAHAPQDIRWEARYVDGGRATLVDRNSPGVQAAQRALQATWDVPALWARMGGGIAAVSQLEEEMGVGTVLVGFGLPDSSIHGPNERLHLPTWRRGMEAITRFFVEARRG